MAGDQLGRARLLSSLGFSCGAFLFRGGGLVLGHLLGLLGGDTGVLGGLGVGVGLRSYLCSGFIDLSLFLLAASSDCHRE